MAKKAKNVVDTGQTRNLTVELIRVNFEKGPFAIVRCKIVKTDAKGGKGVGSAITAKGPIMPRVEGMRYDIVGKVVYDKKWSQYQVIIESCRESKEFSSDGWINYLVKEGPNVGDKRAKQIVDKFGENVMQVLLNDHEKLLEIDGVTEQRAEELCEWAKQEKRRAKLKKELYGLSLTTLQVNKVIDHFGSNADKRIKKECFTLTEVDGFGFKTVCKIADAVGIPDTDEHRLKSAVTYTMQELMQRGGHVCIGQNVLVKEACKNAGVSKNYIIDAIKKMISERSICKQDASPERFTRYPQLFED